MKKLRILLMVTVFVIALFLVSSSCSTNQPDVINVDDEGNTSVDKDALDTTIDEIPVTSLTDSEEEGILYMREEEKLARDVYMQL